MVKKKLWTAGRTKIEVEGEFYRMIELLASQHDIDVICGLVKYPTRKSFVNEWHYNDE